MKTLITITALLTSLFVSAQWTEVNYDTTLNFHRIEFVSSQIAFAAEDSCIYKTTDGGMNWLKIDSTISSYQLCFIDSDTGFSLGNELFRTTDGGNSWQDISLPNVQFYQQIEMKGNCNGKLSSTNGNKMILYNTNDCGKSWQMIHQSTQILSPFASTFTFMDGQHGYGINHNLSELYFSNDSGSSWTLINDTIYFGPTQLSDLVFSDTNTGFVGGWYNGLLKQTTDGGRSWQKSINTAGMPDIVGMEIKDSIIYATEGHFIYKSSDLGKSWYVQNTSLAKSWRSFDANIHIINKDTVYITGVEGEIIKTTNGGGAGTLLSINQNNLQKNRIKIYPNPAKNMLHLQGLDKFSVNSIQLFDIRGKLMQTFSPNKVKLKLTDIPKGVYIIQIKTNQQQISKKLIVN